LVSMEPLTIRVRGETKESLEEEADEYDVSVSEYVRELIEKGREYGELEDRLQSREERVKELEEQLARRSQIEERVDELAIEFREERANVDPPWPVRWYRWFWEG